MLVWRPILGTISRLNHSNTTLANAPEWFSSEIGKSEIGRKMKRIDSKNLKLNTSIIENYFMDNRHITCFLTIIFYYSSDL
jgi:hypothetical protein